MDTCYFKCRYQKCKEKIVLEPTFYKIYTGRVKVNEINLLGYLSIQLEHYITWLQVKGIIQQYYLQEMLSVL